MHNAPILALVGCAGVAIAWLLGLYYMIRVAMSRSSTAKFQWLIVTNPFNSLFFPAELTEAGKVYRKRFFVSILCSIIFLGIIWLASPSPPG